MFLNLSVSTLISLSMFFSVIAIMVLIFVVIKGANIYKELCLLEKFLETRDYNLIYLSLVQNPVYDWQSNGFKNIEMEDVSECEKNKISEIVGSTVLYIDNTSHRHLISFDVSEMDLKNISDTYKDGMSFRMQGYRHVNGDKLFRLFKHYQGDGSGSYQGIFTIDQFEKWYKDFSVRS